MEDTSPQTEWNSNQTTDQVPTEETVNPIMISANTSLDGYRLKNFYITNSFQGFVWMIFHFSVVFFFTFQLESVILVGIFLGIANFIAFLLDIPVGILQRYYSTKKLFIIGAISQLIATGIFFSFIFNFFTTLGDITKIVVPQGFESAMGWFFSNAMNWILILIASFCYGLTKEINDISTYGYILSHASPSEYPKILARNNITYGIGSLIWLVLSGLILSINPTFAVFCLFCIITGFLIFTTRFFDNSSETVELKDITSFTVAVKRVNKENIKEYISERISAVDLTKVLKSAKYIFLKPQRKQEKTFQWSELLDETKKTATIIYTIMSHMPIYIIIYWTMSLVLVFWFWDTFASTFLISFLEDIKQGWGYVLLACIAVPALWLQEVAIRLSEKIGVKTVAMIGLALSGSSLIAMGIFIESGTGIILTCAVINSLWYACGMSLGQNGFLDQYNKIYAETMHLQEIDANASAGPMKILQNAANVIGLVFGGIFLEIMWFRWFFIVFGLIILGILGWSFSRRNTMNI